MKNKMHNPATDMKCRFSNMVHRILEPNIDVKRSHRWRSAYQEKYRFTDAQKIEMFNEIYKLHQELSSELVSYKAEKRVKKHVQKQREARGYVPKKKTSLEEYLKKIA